MVPLTLNVMVSTPVPAAQCPPLGSELAFALAIASRKVHHRIEAVSLVVLTTI